MAARGYSIRTLSAKALMTADSTTISRPWFSAQWNKKEPDVIFQIAKGSRDKGSKKTQELKQPLTACGHGRRNGRQETRDCQASRVRCGATDQRHCATRGRRVGCHPNRRWLPLRSPTTHQAAGRGIANEVADRLPPDTVPDPSLWRGRRWRHNGHIP